MSVKYQVFVSSTYTDLIEERRKVTEAILNLGHIPIGMEAFQASDDTQWDYIKRRIDESDYYVVIIAERYGSESGGKSYTQMEYEYAVAQGVPVAAFLLESSARKSWPNQHVEHDKTKKVEKFRSLCQKKLCKHWRNADDLMSKVILALHELTRDKPRTGWVRADSVPSGNVMNELAALSEEKRQLQAEVARLSADQNTLIAPQDVAWRIKTLANTPALAVMELAGDKFPSVLYLFIALSDILTQAAILRRLMERVGDITNLDLREDDVTPLMLEFVKHDLVDLERKKFSDYPGAAVMDHYKLSSYGKSFLMYAEEWTRLNDVETA